MSFSSRTCDAADLPPLNITYIAESNPFPPKSGSNFSYGDIWSENGYIYVGSDRGYDGVNGQISNGPQGISIFSINNAGVPTFLAPPLGDGRPAGFQATTYWGNEMEDVEVWDGIGYFSSDVNGSSGRTGVDIVNLAIPFLPERTARIDATSCNANGCAHGKVHTISVQRFDEGTPTEQRFLYTADNETDVVKIIDVSDPYAPNLVKSLDLGLSSNHDSHEVVVRNNRLYVASKNPSNTTTDGYFHIYDVTTPSNPVLLKSFLSGGSTHTAMPTEDGNTLIVAEERSNGNVKIYDISMIDQPNDPQSPTLLATLNRTSLGIDAHSPHHIHIHGNLMFLPWYESGLQVFNIANPSNPIRVGHFDTCRQGIDQACFASGTSTNYNGLWGVDLSMGLNRVLLSDRTRGLIVVDASKVVAPGDYDIDMDVDEDDYATWAANYGSTRAYSHNAPFADGNYNGVTDISDYVIWRMHSAPPGSGSAAGGAVPEPATWLMLAIAAAAAGVGRRGHRARF